MLRVEGGDRRDDLFLLFLFVFFLLFFLLLRLFFCRIRFGHELGLFVLPAVFVSGEGRQEGEADAGDEDRAQPPRARFRRRRRPAPPLPPLPPLLLLPFLLLFPLLRAPPLPRDQHPAPRRNRLEPPSEPAEAHALEDAPRRGGAEERRRQRGGGAAPAPAAASIAASGDGVGAPPVVQPRHVIRVRVREEEGGHGRAARRARPPAVDCDERVARHRDEDGAHRFVRLGFESSFPVSSSSLALSGSSLSPFVLARGPDAASDGSHEGEREGRKEEKRGVSRRRSLFSRCHPKEEKK